MRNIKTIVASVLCISIIIVFFCGCSGQKNDAPPQHTTAALPERHPRDGIQTILITSIAEGDQAASDGLFRNGKSADLIMLIVVDTGRGKTTALQLNPDTEVTFTEQGSQELQRLPLGQVYSFGSGGSDSFLNLKKAVSVLLGGITIDHYMSFTQDSIRIVNDSVGGVDVPVDYEFPTDFEALQQGETVHLQGENAIVFFGYRDENDFTNEAHMIRQQQYMAKLFPLFISNMQDDDYLTKLTMQLGDRLQTDLTLSQMVEMMDLLRTCPLDENILTLPGSTQVTDDGPRYIADADTFGQIIEELLY